jgi:hypothetical protein
MVHFIEPIDNQRLAPESPIFLVQKRWRCWWEYRGMKRFMDIVAGYPNDGMSVPKPGQHVTGLSPEDYPNDVVPHDVSYRSEGGRNLDALLGCTITNHNGNRVLLSRWESDWLLWSGIKHRGASLWQRLWVRLTTITFGGLHWGGPMPCYQ